MINDMLQMLPKVIFLFLVLISYSDSNTTPSPYSLLSDTDISHSPRLDHRPVRRQSSGYEKEKMETMDNQRIRQDNSPPIYWLLAVVVKLLSYLVSKGRAGHSYSYPPCAGWC